MFDCELNKIHILARLGAVQYALKLHRDNLEHTVTKYEQMQLSGNGFTPIMNAKYIDTCTDLYIMNAFLEFSNDLYKDLMQEESAK